MTNATEMEGHKIHEGKNIRRFREIMGLKQDALASLLGEGWTQRRISLLEQKESIELPILQEVSAVLKIPVEAFQNFDEDKAVHIVTNTFQDFKDNAVGMNYQCSFNPIDKLVETFDKNEKLYEQLLKSEREKIAMLEKQLAEKRK